MERIAAIVEGHLEWHFVKATYGAAIVQRCIPNGVDVSIDLIVATISDQLDIIDHSIEKILILMDRERRTYAADDMRSEIATKLKSQHPTRRFYLGIADRQAENWILADEQLMQARYENPSYRYCGDGVQGKPRLAQMTRFDLSPHDKATLLKSTSPSRSRQMSPSLHNFVSEIDFHWPWALR